MNMRTHWIPPGIKPELPGVYERQYPSGNVRFNKWDGEQWHCFGDSVRAADLMLAPTDADLPWRGLAENPYK